MSVPLPRHFPPPVGRDIKPTEKRQDVHGYYNYLFTAEEAKVIIEALKKRMEVYSQ